MSSTNRGGQRTPADFYPTPSWCVRRALEAVELPGGRWLEPCAGEGAIIAATQAVRSDVQWHAVELRGECLDGLQRTCGPERARQADFLTDDSCIDPERYDVLLTNPPFSGAEEFLKRGLEVAEHVVLLLRLNFAASAKRAPLMHDHPPDVYVLPNRPSFTGKGTDSIEYAWFHWHAGRTEPGRFVVLPTTPIDERKGGSLQLGLV